jgi:hypothetical protein
MTFKMRAHLLARGVNYLPGFLIIFTLARAWFQDRAEFDPSARADLTRH